MIKSENDSLQLFKLAYDLMESGGLIVIQDYMRIDHESERNRLDTLEDLYVFVTFDPGAGDREGRRSGVLASK